MITMKKTIYISGVITANLLLIGCIFKLNHWPGAGVALSLSLLSLSLWFLPISLINHYKGQKDKSKKWLYVATFLSFFVVSIAVLFKIQHWPGASLLLIIGVPIPFLLFLPVYIYHSIKDREQSSVNFTAIILGLIFIAIYSGLLNINVSKEVLDHGIFLTKSNENAIDYYEQHIANMIEDNSIDEKTMGNINNVLNKSNAICSSISSAKRDLLDYSENEHLGTDLGDKTYIAGNINNLDSRNSSKYVLIWKDDAMVPQIKKEISSFTKYLKTLNVNEDIQATVDAILNIDDISIDDEMFSWEEREFASDYTVYALEALSRWEKNVRFIESAVVVDLINSVKMDSNLLAEINNEEL